MPAPPAGWQPRGHLLRFDVGNVSRRHHFIPRFHLARFKSADEKIWVLDQASLKQWASPVDDVACCNNLYSVDVPGHATDAFEKAFAEVEGKAAEVIKNVLEMPRPPQPEEIEILANYLALLVVRVPGKRASIEKFVDRVYRDVAKLIVATEDRWTSTFAKARAAGAKAKEVGYQQVKAFVESDAYAIKMGQNWHMQILSTQLDPMIQLLAARDWSICVSAGQQPEFICSDTPVSLEWIPAGAGPWPPGFGHRNTEVIVPLSTRVALVGRFSHRPSIIGANAHDVAAINSRTGRCAHRFLYSASTDFAWLMRTGGIGNKANLRAAISKSRSKNE